MAVHLARQWQERVRWDASAKRALAPSHVAADTLVEPETLKNAGEKEVPAAATPVTVTCSTLQLTQTERTALVNCRWPGRSQCIEVGDTVYYLDGAHTLESCEALVQWLRQRLPPRGPDAQG